MKKIISFDIDGVLNDYPKCWVKYINVKMRTNFSSKTQAKKKKKWVIQNIIL